MLSSSKSSLATAAEATPPSRELTLVEPNQREDANDETGVAPHLAVTKGTGLAGALRHSRPYASPGTRNARPRAVTDAGPTEDEDKGD